MYLPELDPERPNYYQSLIGILRWAVEIGRVHINTEVSMMSSQLALPRERHLAEVFHMFAHLKKYTNTEMVFDPTYPSIDESQLARNDWSGVYGDTKEAIPPNTPEALGK
jgi:hypothetical protein